MLTIAYLLAQAAFRALAGRRSQVPVPGRWGGGACPVAGCQQGVAGLCAGRVSTPGGLLWGEPIGVAGRGLHGAVGNPRGQLSLLGVCPPAHSPAQEFENAEGDDYVTELSAQGSPAPQHGPEVYVLPLTKVSLPMAKQPGRSGKPGWGRVTVLAGSLCSLVGDPAPPV